jgi:hypothetical protein
MDHGKRFNVMTTKNAKDEVIQARNAAFAALDSKIGNMPEWRIFRHLDRALLALEEDQSAQPPTLPVTPRPRTRLHLNGAHPSYMSLADRALTEAGKPLRTDKLMQFIGQHRPLSSGDPAKAKIVVQSSLSKDKRFKSVPWEGKRAWWYVDRPVPKAT